MPDAATTLTVLSFRKSRRSQGVQRAFRWPLVLLEDALTVFCVATFQLLAGEEEDELEDENEDEAPLGDPLPA